MAKTRWKARQQCEATVYRADVMRRTGRGPSGFEMHYERGRCKRRAETEVRNPITNCKYKPGGLCWQHERISAHVLRYTDR